MPKIIISDTSCLIALSRIDKLEILHHIFSNIITTREVQLEFGETLPAWIEIKKVSDESKFEEIKQNLDVGEASAISLALETEKMQCLLLTRKRGGKLPGN